MSNDFRQRLIRREQMMGTLLTLPSPEIAEICAEAGFDWLFLDMEHGMLDFQDVQHMVQAVCDRCACVVRVPSNDPIFIKKALDIGVAGLIIPQVNSADEAARAVRASKFPPLGARSVGIARAHGYGMHFQKYVENANENTAVIVQVEHIESVRNVEKILEVEGVDCVFIGPYDLSASMGKPGRIKDDDVAAAIEHARKTSLSRSMTLGTFAREIEGGKTALSNGYTLVAVGQDITMISNMAAKILTSVKPGKD